MPVPLPRSSAALLVLLALATPHLRAQERPKVGLVLSGGGARGCAHVGVLQVLDELRVPVDVVAGTSMGSIVGGLFAYGYGPRQLEEELVRAGDRRPWSALLNDEPPRSRLSFRRRQEDFELPVDFGLGFRGGQFRLPKGLKQGQNLDLELRQLVLLAHDLDSFDALRLPFRAVAVELGTGRQVVLERGNLAAAMRASMSLPGIFAPANVDGRDLLDGGLVDNVPVDVARGLGAQRLIVVDIGTPLTEVEVGSALDVSEQMVQILTQQNVDRSLATLTPQDLLITPDLGDITSADFGRAAESIALGRKAALAVADRLRAHAVGEDEYRAWRARQRRPAEAVPVLDAVRIDNRSGLGEDLIRARVHAQPGRPLDVARLRADLERIFGLGDFESVTFTLERGTGDGRVLVIHATAKSWGPTYVKFGLSLSSNLTGQSAFDASAQVNMRELNSLGGEWRNTLQIGDVSTFLSEWYQPLTASGRVFVAPRVQAQYFETRPTAGGFFDVRLYAAGVDLGWNIAPWAEARVGVTRITGDVDAETVLGVSGFDFDEGTLDAQLVVDTLDHADFPETGTRLAARWSMADGELGADADYQGLTLSGTGFVTLGSTTLGLGARYLTPVEGRFPVYRVPSLGGFGSLSGSERNSIGGQHVAHAALLVRQHVAGTRAEMLGFPTYVGFTVEAGNAADDRDALLDDLRLAGSVFLGLNTPLGPTYLAYGYTEGGEDAVYLFVGQVF